MDDLVLVGGAGGIGRELANRAHADGWKVTVMDLEKSLSKHPPSNGIKSKIIDLTDPSSITGAFSGFSVKLPIWPAYTWLLEAPTLGSSVFEFPLER